MLQLDGDVFALLDQEVGLDLIWFDQGVQPMPHDLQILTEMIEQLIRFAAQQLLVNSDQLVLDLNRMKHLDQIDISGNTANSFLFGLYWNMPIFGHSKRGH